MKKKLVGLLAAAMVLSMGMTAFAADSPNSGSTEPKATVTSGNATVVGSAPETIGNASATQTAKQISSKAEILEVVNVVYNGNPADLAKGVKITLTAPALKSGYKYMLLHYNAETGKWDRVPVVSYKNGEVTGLFTDLSPVAIAMVPDSGKATDGTSPKTGSAYPVLPVLAMLCLAGVGVCGRKVKFNA